MIREHLTEHIQKVLGELNLDAPVHLEHPNDLSHGDYATNVALVAAKKAGANPREIAEKVVKKLGDIEHVEKIEIAGPGFINFHLSRDFFAKSTDEIVAAGDRWGKGDELAGKKVMVEFTDPNPFKVFHIGHLMSNAIGESIARLVEFSGAMVKRANWQGDVGLHIGKALYGLIHNSNLDPKNVADLGEAYVLGNKAYEEDEVGKKEVIELNKKAFNRDPEIIDLYSTGRQTSLDRFEELYDILGTKFDHYFFEGTEGRDGVPIVEEHLKKGIFEESDGAVVFRGEKYGHHTRVFITSEGLPTYEAKELGLNKAKFEREPDLDKSIIVTAVEQKTYFDVLVAAMKEVMPDIGNKTVHISHGMMQLSSGKMSSRKGNVVTGESLLVDTIALAKEKNEDQETAEQVAVAAIKYQILKQAMGKNIAYDKEKSLAVEGDSGPYLQYAHTRAKSLLEKGGEGSTGALPESVTEMERLLYRFPEVVERAAAEYEPHHVVQYLTELAGAFNSFYANEKIIGGSHEGYLLKLTKAFKITMKNGLWVLGIKTPERM